MAKFFENMLRSILAPLGFNIVRESTVAKAINFDRLRQALKVWTIAPPILSNFVLNGLERSYSAQQQDLLAEFISQFSMHDEEKYFVEFGAASWKLGSNTYLLETTSWKGILAEPSKYWQKNLLRRRSSQVDFRCVSAISGDFVSFFESENPYLSTQRSLVNEDFNRERRKPKNVYMVETVSLEDLLFSYSSPRFIDYLSIDTEGNEFDILKSFFPNSNFCIGFLTVEHNFTFNQELIYDLLTKHGYIRILETVSNHEDWYVLPSAYKPELVDLFQGR
jgi:Methyltransferase FkbM domain